MLTLENVCKITEGKGERRTSSLAESQRDDSASKGLKTMLVVDLESGSTAGGGLIPGVTAPDSSPKGCLAVLLRRKQKDCSGRTARRFSAGPAWWIACWGEATLMPGRVQNAVRKGSLLFGRLYFPALSSCSLLTAAPGVSVVVCLLSLFAGQAILWLEDISIYVMQNGHN